MAGNFSGDHGCSARPRALQLLRLMALRIFCWLPSCGLTCSRLPLTLHYNRSSWTRGAEASGGHYMMDPGYATGVRPWSGSGTLRLIRMHDHLAYQAGQFLHSCIFQVCVLGDVRCWSIHV